MSRKRASYERVEWFHDSEDEPRFIYSELDNGRHETRKTEVFEDGRMVGVSEEKPELGPIGLAEEPYPTGEEIYEQKNSTPKRLVRRSSRRSGGVPAGKLATRHRREER